MPPQQPQGDPDFAKLSPGEQHAYLTETSADYRQLSPSDQKAYLQAASPTHGAGTPEDFAAEKTASGSIAPPLNSAWDATKYGMKEFGGGMADIGRGIYDTLKPPESSGGKLASMMVPGALPLYRMGKGIVGLGQQAMQVPGAIKDLSKSPDPLGTLALTAPRVGGQAAGAYIAGKAPEMAQAAAETPIGSAVGRAGKGMLSGTGEMIMHSPLIGEPLRAFGRGFMRSWNGPEPPPLRSVPEPPLQWNTRTPEAPTQAAIPPIQRNVVSPGPSAVKPAAVPPLRYGMRQAETATPAAVPPVRYSVQGTPEVPNRMVPPPPTRYSVRPTRSGMGTTNAPVTFVPEPRAPFAGEEPNYMASVPRSSLGKAAMSRKPGAGTQMQQLGQPIIYIPDEADYPGPRR
jgi:hypothetical protein